jgi:ribosomal protein S18 acetylase RimI-like enzyme
MQSQSVKLIVSGWVCSTEWSGRDILITIRRIQIGETALYKQIRLTSLKDAPYAFETTYDSALQRSDEMWHARVESTAKGSDTTLFLAFSDNLPIGIAALVRIKGQADTGELMQVWVSSDYRGTNVAWKLIDAIFEWAEENSFRRIIAEVTKRNARALKFYIKYGFFVIPESLQNDSDGVSLAKEIRY